MIAHETVFILGAGASQPYNYPTGPELKEQIETELLDNGHMYIALEALGFDGEEIDLFARDLKMSGKYSIDAFLENRPDLLNIGRHSILLGLLGCEDEIDLFSAKRGSDWYKALFNEMCQKFDDFSKNKISFVTFNYDRSLEYYFYYSLMSNFGKQVGEDAIVKAISTIPIIHLHGNLGDAHWIDGGRKYDGKSRKFELSSASADDFLTLSKKIEIVSGADESNQHFQKARNFIAGAKRVAFYGFGFGGANLRRLGIRWNDEGCEYFSTHVGMANKLRAELLRVSNKRLSFDYGQTILHHLTESAVLDTN